MNLCIFLLLLILWTSSGLHTNKSDGPPPNGTKHLESTETKMENFRRPLLIIMIVVMIIVFAYRCFYFLHYDCLSDEARMVRKETVAARSSRSSKLLFSESKRARLRILEEQPMLLDIGMLPGPSSLGKLSITSSTENLTGPLSPQISSTQSITEKFIRPLSQEKISRLSSPKMAFSSPHLEMPRKTCSLDMLHELDGLYNPLGQGSFSYPNTIIKSPCPVLLQYLVKTTKPPVPLYPEYTVLLHKSSDLPKCVKSSIHSKVKESVTTGMANILSRPQLVKPCHCHQEKLLVSATISHSKANDIFEPKKTNFQTRPSPHEANTFSRSVHEVVSGDHGNGADRRKMTNESDDGSDEEITIICNVHLHELIPKGAQHN